MLRTAVLSALLALLALPSTGDAQAQSVILSFQVIEADGFTERDPAIEDVRQTLQELFRFRGYRLAAEAVIRVSHGSFSQKLATADGAAYHIGADQVVLVEAESAGAPTIALSDLALHVTNGDRLISTSLRVPVGQTVVVGSGRPSSDGPTLILVVRTRPGG